MQTRDDLVLIFAYHYPPDTAIGGARPYRFSKYLQRLGYRIQVISAAKAGGTPEPGVSYIADPFYATPRDGAGWQVERAIRRTLLPGASGLRWALRASELARCVIRENAGSRVTLLSTYPPVGAHVAGWLTARSENIPWIADFRDPMADRRVLDGATALHKISLGFLERWFVLRRASLMIANTDVAAGHYLREYPGRARDIRLIWNGFDPEQRLEPIYVPGREQTMLTHTGELYVGRTAAPVLESIQRLIDSGRLRAGRIRVRLVGPAAPYCLPQPEFLERARAQGWLDLVNDSVPREEALNLMRSSDALLLLQPQSTVQVPGKLFEYLLTGHPILAFVPTNSPVERILEKSGIQYRCVHPEDSGAGFDDTIAAFFELPMEPARPSAWFEDNFSAEKQADQLDRLIRELHSR
jgi:hypothetical protein